MKEKGAAAHVTWLRLALPLASALTLAHASGRAARQAKLSCTCKRNVRKVQRYGAKAFARPLLRLRRRRRSATGAVVKAKCNHDESFACSGLARAKRERKLKRGSDSTCCFSLSLPLSLSLCVLFMQLVFDANGDAFTATTTAKTTATAKGATTTETTTSRTSAKNFTRANNCAK